MKRLLKLFPVSLIALGSTLEILYYAKRFINDGIEIWLSIIIGVALTLFLSLLMFKRDKKTTWLIIVPLAAYSILCTSAGQSFSLGVRQNEIITAEAQELTRQDQINEYLNDIRLLDRELGSLLTVSTVEDINDRWKYEGVIKRTEARQNEIRTEKKELQSKITDLRAQQTTHEGITKPETNIYKFYNGLFGINERWLQFILQTVLSAFIAIMSPFGIVILTANKEQPKPQQPKKIDYAPYVKPWVNLSWLPYRQNKITKMLPADKFYSYWNTQLKQGHVDREFPKAIYDEIKKAAILLKLVDKNGNLIDNRLNDSEKAELIINKLKE